MLDYHCFVWRFSAKYGGVLCYYGVCSMVLSVVVCSHSCGSAMFGYYGVNLMSAYYS